MLVPSPTNTIVAIFVSIIFGFLKDYGKNRDDEMDGWVESMMRESSEMVLIMNDGMQCIKTV